jgi:HSP20 family protein
MTKFNYPVDIFQKDDTLNFNIACVGLTKDNLQLETNEDVLRVIYEKPKEEADDSIYYLNRSITRKSFNFGWKTNPRFDLAKAKAKMENGLLEISIPMREESKPKTLQIK